VYTLCPVHTVCTERGLPSLPSHESIERNALRSQASASTIEHHSVKSIDRHKSASLCQNNCNSSHGDFLFEESTHQSRHNDYQTTNCSALPTEAPILSHYQPFRCDSASSVITDHAEYTGYVANPAEFIINP